MKVTRSFYSKEIELEKQISFEEEQLLNEFKEFNDYATKHEEERKEVFEEPIIPEDFQSDFDSIVDLVTKYSNNIENRKNEAARQLSTTKFIEQKDNKIEDDKLFEITKEIQYLEGQIQESENKQTEVLNIHTESRKIELEHKRENANLTSDRLDNEIAEYTQKIEQEENELSKLYSEPKDEEKPQEIDDTADDSTISDFKSQLDEVNNKLDKLQERQLKIDETKSKNEEEIAKLTEIYNNLIKSIEARDADDNDPNNQSITKDIDVLLSSLQAKLNSQKFLINFINSQQTTVSQKKENIRQSLKDVEVRYKQQNNKINNLTDLKNELSQIESENNQKRDEINKLEEKIKLYAEKISISQHISEKIMDESKKI